MSVYYMKNHIIYECLMLYVYTVNLYIISMFHRKVCTPHLGSPNYGPVATFAGQVQGRLTQLVGPQGRARLTVMACGKMDLSVAMEDYIDVITCVCIYVCV